MKKETVKFNSRGFSGNTFHILGMVQTALKKQQRITDFNNCRDRVLKSHSYDEALTIIREYVDLIDESGEK